MPDFKLPDLGENIAAGDVVSLLVKEGDVVKPQQDVIEIETEKAVIPVPSSLGGRVAKIFTSSRARLSRSARCCSRWKKRLMAATAKLQPLPGKSPAKADSSAKSGSKPAPAKPAPAKAEAPKEKAATGRPAPAAEPEQPSQTSTRDNGHPAEPAPPRTALPRPPEPGRRRYSRGLSRRRSRSRRATAGPRAWASN